MMGEEGMDWFYHDDHSEEEILRHLRLGPHGKGICTVPYCPAPSDPDWHHCLLCQKPSIEHHHVAGRGSERTYRPEGIVALCNDHHEKITLNHYADSVEDGHYVVRNKQGQIIFRKVIPTRDTALGTQGAGQVEPSGSQLSEEDRGTHSPQTQVSLSPDAPGPSSDLALPQQVTRVKKHSGRLSFQAVDLQPAHGLPSSPAEAAPAAPGSSTEPLSGWKASDLLSLSDEALAEDYRRFSTMSGMLRLEAYRRIDAIRLRYEGVAGGTWVQLAAPLFDLDEASLYDYSRAWQAFEQAIVSDFYDPDWLAHLGGTIWQIIGHAPRERWERMTEIAVNVLADLGPRKALAGAVIARATEEGVLERTPIIWGCLECGLEGKQKDFKHTPEEWAGWSKGGT